MLLKTLRFISLLLTALTLAPLYAHVLELPGKMTLSGAEWLAVQHNLYGGFALSGAFSEILGLLATLALAVLVRKRRLAFALTLVAALCFVGMLVVFALGNNPINGQIAAWTPATLPANWRQARDAWEACHATSAGLAAVAFCTLLIATLCDTVQPSEQQQAQMRATAVTMQ